MHYRGLTDMISEPEEFYNIPVISCVQAEGSQNLGSPIVSRSLNSKWQERSDVWKQVLIDLPDHRERRIFPLPHFSSFWTSTWCMMSTNIDRSDHLKLKHWAFPRTLQHCSKIMFCQKSGYPFVQFSWHRKSITIDITRNREWHQDFWYKKLKFLLTTHSVWGVFQKKDAW